MYIAVTGSKNNKDIYIYQSFRKKDGKSSSRIYKKLGKYNTLLEQFDGDNEKLMAWAREFDTLKSKKVPQSLEIGLFFCQIFIFII